MPEDIKRVIHSKAKGIWLSEKEWEKVIKSRFSFGTTGRPFIKMTTGVRVPFQQYLNSMKKKPFILFFTTSFDPDPPGWQSLMSAQGYRFDDPSFGKYVIINGIERHGSPISRVHDLDDVMMEMKGDDTLLLIEHNKVPIAFLGDVDDYPHLLKEIKEEYMEE